MPERENHSYFRAEIERSKRRLADMEERGVDAMSHYDVEIATKIPYFQIDHLSLPKVSKLTEARAN